MKFRSRGSVRRNWIDHRLRRALRRAVGSDYRCVNFRRKPYAVCVATVIMLAAVRCRVENGVRNGRLLSRVPLWRRLWYRFVGKYFAGVVAG